MSYTNKQIIENRKTWEAALASGEYHQGSFKLCRDHDEDTKRYCCLGVACELFLGEPDNSVQSYSGLNTYFWNDQSKLPPAQVVEALGLYSSNGNNKDHLAEALTVINDRNSDEFTSVLEAIKTGDYYKPLN